MRRLWPAVPLAVLLTSLAVSQDPSDVRGVKRWYGDVKIRIKSKGAVTFTDGRDSQRTEWTDDEDTQIVVEMGHRNDDAGRSIYPGTTPPPPEKNRWHSWRNSRNVQDEIACWSLGDCSVKTVRDSTGEAKSPIKDTVNGSRKLAGLLTSGDVELELDLKEMKYSLIVPDPAKFRNLSEFHVRDSFRHVHEQPTIPPRISQGTGSDAATGYQRGNRLPTADFESDGNRMKILERPLPTDPRKLSGTTSIPMKPIVKGNGLVEATMTIEWTFSAAPPPKIELEVEAEGIDEKGARVRWPDWRPMGGPDEAVAGSHVRITARVVSEENPLPDKVKWIALRLTESSAEKGICLNFPDTPKTPPDPDLAFGLLENKTLNVVPEHVSEWYPKGDTITGDLSCFDYGAWGTVIAEAELASGRRILGRIKGSPGERKLRIPHRSEKSLIATSWQSPGKDLDDLDDDPKGDGNAGDGFTNYEEYRGFRVNGKWTDGDKKKKDFFIRNRAGSIAEGGITMFEGASGLRVHRLAGKEFPASRIINFNRTAGPHKVDQHGILIRNEPTYVVPEATRMPGVKFLGTPKDYAFVGLAPITFGTTNFLGGAVPRGSYADPTVAHELFHTCNVYHHGEEPGGQGSKPVVWKKVGDDIFENGVKIRVLSPIGEDVSGRLKFKNTGGGLTLDQSWMAWGGSASGAVECIMKYDNATTFTPKWGAPTDRVALKILEEASGSILCDTNLATGTNLPPHERFGPCQAGRGFCRRQILVNDAVRAPTR